MLDPFFIPRIGLVSRISQPIADYFSLPTLPLHAHEIIFAFLLYHFTNTIFSPYLSSRLFPDTYRSLNKRTRINWDVHVVSLLQSTLINTLAIWVILHDEERGEMNWKGRVWGYTGAGGLIQAFATGYFLWDLWVSLVHLDVFGPGLLAHAVAALTVFALGFRPFVNYYAPIFILYELSSPFLNIHWFCDKLSLTGSRIQLVNGIILLGTFFSCRLVYGTWMSLSVFADVFRAYRAGYVSPAPVSSGATTAAVGHEPVSDVMKYAGQRGVPLWMAASYLTSNLVLNGLNWYWFGQMIDALRKRFDPPFGTRVPEKKEIDVQRGVYEDGHKSVEINEKSVRSRKTAAAVEVM